MATRVSIRPSALGSKGLLLLATLELAFLATNYSNLFFLMLAFCAVLGVLGAYWSLRNLRGLHVVKLEVAAAACDASRGLDLRLAADKRPRFDLVIELDVHNGYVEVGYAPCLVGTTTTSDVVPGQPRGVRQLDHVRVTSGFPFGFFIARTKLLITEELITHPTPVPFGDAGRAKGQAGERGALAAGRGSVLAGLRAFRTGDGMADVHWKATARRGKAVVKERERERAPAVDIVLDRRCDEATLEQALSQITTQVLAARHGAPLCIHSQGIELLVDPDRGGARQALRWLAAASTLPGDAQAPPDRRTATQLPLSQSTQARSTP